MISKQNYLPGSDVPPLESRSVAALAAEKAFRSGDLEASLLASIVARHRGFTVAELFQQTRSRAPVAIARQIAMYLMHVTLSRSFTQVGEFYGRDRTTVSYACEVIEDMRDNREFDAEVTAMELEIATHLDQLVQPLASDAEAANDQ